MNKILQVAVATYIAANAARLKKLNLNAEELAAYVGKQFENILKYFRTHKEQQVFFSTADEQVFRTASQAWNHAQSQENRTILEINRADVLTLLEEQPAAPAKQIDRYEGADMETLKAICTEKEITVDENDTEETLRQKLADAHAAKKEEENKKPTHELLLGNQKQVLSKIKNCNDSNALREALKIEQNVNSRAKVIEAIEKRIAELEAAE